MGWVTALVSGLMGGVAAGQASNSARQTMELGGEQADTYYRFGEYNARNIEMAGAEEDRRAFLNEETVRSVTVARAAASGFTLSGTPQDYLDRQRQIFGEELAYKRKTVRIAADQTREEASTRAKLAYRYGAQAGEIQINQGRTAALNGMATGIGTFAKLYNPANNGPGESGGGPGGGNGTTSGGNFYSPGDFSGADIGGVGGAPY